MVVKMLAMDIDGTLLDSRWQIPPANLDAIVEAANRGIEVVLVTGRRFDFALPVAERLPCDLFLIVNNGALIKSMDGLTHLRFLLQRETARQVLEATREFRTGAAVIFDRPKARQIIVEELDWSDPTRHAYYERNSEYMAQVSPLESCLEEDPIQVMFTGSFERMRAVHQRLQNLPIANSYSLAITEYEKKDFSILDVISRSCSKGSTLEEWANRRGIAREEVMAVGDNWNDHEMLEYAGFPVVMGNGIPELKMRGWPVTLSNDEGGLAAAIRTYALGQ
ncbi:MAG: Cof-type HAD-IIB family hydrolase [Candidatus Acidiferrales bacterium]